jgi:hypothetical protein
LVVILAVALAVIVLGVRWLLLHGGRGPSEAGLSLTRRERRAQLDLEAWRNMNMPL